MKRNILLLIIALFLVTLLLSSCFLIKLQFTLNSSPQGINVLIDNSSYITPVSTNLSYGPHTIEIMPTYATIGNYAGISNTLYMFSSWSDGSTQNPRQINLTSAQSYSFTTSTYYKFVLGSNEGVLPSATPVSQNGFYLSGSQVQISAPNIPNYIFKYWMVNGQVIPGNPLTQFLTLPTQATAIYAQIVPPSISLLNPLNGGTGVSTDVTISWYGSDPNNLPLTYSLYFGTSDNPPLYISNLSASQYTISNLNYSTTYYWYVVADNGYLSTKSPLWSFTTKNEPIPSAPSNLYQTSVTYNSASFSWSTSPFASGYNVYRSTNGVNFSNIASVNVTSYTDTNLSPSTTYYYEVTAYNPSGESGYSNQIAITTQPIVQQYGTITGSVNVYTGQSAFVSSASIVPTANANWQIQKYTGPDYVPNQVVVGFKSGITPKMLSIYPSPFKYQILSSIQTPNYEVNASLITVSTSVENAISYFKSLSNVAYAEPNYIVHALSVSVNDPYYSNQWYLQDIEAPQAWSVATGANTVIVAVVDTGVSSTHPDLQNILVPGYNFVNNTTNTMDDFGHGTFVTGIIDADTNNGIGIAGINWGSSFSTKIMPIVVLDSSGSGSTYYVSEGIIYAVEHGAKVINLSLGGVDYSQTEQLACQYAYNNNVVVVAAAGNDSSNSLEYPAAFPTVIPVASVAPSGSSYTLAYYSNYYSNVLCAPGGQMYSQNDPNGVFSTTYSTSTNTNGYGYGQGTSFAAPQVSAIAALMIGRGITGVSNITSILENTATNIGSQSTFGYGLVNAYNAVTYNGGWEPMIVWAQTSDGTAIVAQTQVSANGSFSMTVPVGNYQIYAWQDFNGDGKIDQGDFYGYYGYHGTQSTPLTLSVNANQTCNVGIQVSPEVSTPPSLYGTSLEALHTFIQSAVKAHYEALRSALKSSQ